MKKLVVQIIFLVLIFKLQSQSIESIRLPNGMIDDQKYVEYTMENNYPGYKDYVNARYANIARQINDIENHQTGNRSTLEIKVVVHIVWKDSTENIPLSIIQDQIDIINEDFQRRHSDTGSLRSIFHPIVGNPNISFQLAHVERVQTSATFSRSSTPRGNNNIKYSSFGGSDAWAVTNYLNVWVGNLSNGDTFGYATYPWYGVSNIEQGVVIHYKAFGPTGLFGGYALQGRTLIHEIGHYLGLRHPWGGCSDGDSLADTPNTLAANFFCDTSMNFCIDSVDDMPDMVENYMDYSEDACMVAFTADQAALMRTVLQTDRSSLLTTVNINKNHNEFEINLFPNPSNGIINYDININELDNLDISVLDLSGKIIYKKNNTSKIGSIDLININKGIYVFNAFSNDFIVSKRIAVQ